ncbi:FecR protein [Parapedobacter composti]|uniref:FecR protein n=1 Tax=Parapedobacter composti TaxID=623281 RepID=A0A1I1J9V9_9SPHI|nr:FecR family protein [Parapedobacter composti]SFC45389.1 FecR protein [Parapedobacter composti]
MDRQQAKQLLARYLSGDCTPNERALVEAWYNKVVDDQAPIEADPDWDALERHLATQLSLAPRQPLRRLRWYNYAAAAASILFIAAVAYWGYLRWNGAGDSGHRLVGDLPPGGYRAELVLADGSRLTLVEHEEIIVTETSITYPDGSEVTSGDEQGSDVLTLSTPIGGQYRLLLPDGSKVWLNAESSITYPRKFNTGSSREVSLAGEAYFEVAKVVDNNAASPKLFVVHTAGQRIEVHGTTFNVNAYPGENTTTTLLSGAVKIAPIGAHANAARQPQGTLLRPGQQATDINGRLAITEASTGNAIAWKNGSFLFDNESLTQIMKQLQRWYGFTVTLSELPNLHFTGGIKRDVPLSKVLRMLEATRDDISFELNDRKVTVKRNH